MFSAVRALVTGIQRFVVKHTQMYRQTTVQQKIIWREASELDLREAREWLGHFGNLDWAQQTKPGQLISFCTEAGPERRQERSEAGDKRQNPNRI